MQANKTTRLCWLWIITYIIWLIFCRVYEAIAIINSGSSPISEFGSYRIIGLLIVMLYFYPLLFIIHRSAIQANMKKVSAISLVLIIIISFWIVLNIASFVIALVS